MPSAPKLGAASVLPIGHPASAGAYRKPSAATDGDGRGPAEDGAATDTSWQAPSGVLITRARRGSAGVEAANGAGASVQA